jgi:predicted class III extradiol MEMO1 family dioxygenase
MSIRHTTVAGSLYPGDAPAIHLNLKKILQHSCDE